MAGIEAFLHLNTRNRMFYTWGDIRDLRPLESPPITGRNLRTSLSTPTALLRLVRGATQIIVFRTSTYE